MSKQSKRHMGANIKSAEGVDAITVADDGRVGIGTDNPNDCLLDVSGADGVKIRHEGCTLELLGRGDLGYAIVGTDTDHELRFRTNNSDRMRIDASGRLLVNTASVPSGVWNSNSRFHFKGGLQLTHTGNDTKWRQLSWSGDTNDGSLYFPNGSNVPQLSATGTWISASDGRQKTNITQIKYGLSTVLKAQPRSYNRTDVQGDYIGFIAQEMKELIPEVVAGSDETHYGLDYGSLVAVAFKAIQELKAELDEAKAEIAALRKQP